MKEYKKLLCKKQYTHLKVLQLRYSGRDSIIQVRIDLIFIMVPLGEQKIWVSSISNICIFIYLLLLGGGGGGGQRHISYLLCNGICSIKTYIL